MNENFYAIIKLISGEEIFGQVEEFYDDQAKAILVCDPCTIKEIPSRRGNFSFYKLGTVVYIEGGYPVEIQRLQRDDFYEIQKSELTMPSVNFPTYLYESGSLSVSPGGVTGITQNVQANFIRRPVNVVWAYSVGGLGQYNYNPGASYDFELLPEEQTNIILRILQYSGIIIRDPQIVQAAASEIQQNEINKKS